MWFCFIGPLGSDSKILGIRNTQDLRQRASSIIQLKEFPEPNLDLIETPI